MFCLGIPGNKLCVALFDFSPLIKRVSQFLIKGKVFLERDRGERERELCMFHKSPRPQIEIKINNFKIAKTNRLKVGLNAFANRLFVLNGLDWGFETFKEKCKKLFIN